MLLKARLSIAGPSRLWTEVETAGYRARYVRHDPLLIFELLWKTIWILAAWLPLYLAHHLDPDTAEQAFSIFLGPVVMPIVLPWGYIWKHYVVARGDRWR